MHMKKLQIHTTCAWESWREGTIWKT